MGAFAFSGSLLMLLFGQGKINLESRITGLGRDLDIAPMFPHDALDGIEA